MEHIIELMKAKGTNDKKDIIRKYKNDSRFKEYLYYILNPMLTYKLSAKTLDGDNIEDIDMFYDYDIFGVCEYLANIPAMDSDTLAGIRGWLLYYDKETEEFFRQILFKKLRLGVTAKTVNEIIPNLIPCWEVQQAYQIEKYPVKNNRYFYLTQKLNGVRATYYKGKLYARSGVPYEGLEHITKELDCFKDKFVFDGELLLKDEYRNGLSDNESFRKSTGIINSDAEQKPEIVYNIFDIVDVEEFEDDNCTVNYGLRRFKLDNIADIVYNNSENVKILPLLYKGTDQSKIWELLDKMVAEDKEGLMLNYDVPYRRTRHNGILKVKRFYTMDLPIIAYNEGTGRLANTLGSVTVAYKGNSVNVGSGFSDELRTKLWEEPEDMIGRIIEVKYKEISTDKKTGKESLQFPIFVRFRDDKRTVSYD